MIIKDVIVPEDCNSLDKFANLFAETINSTCEEVSGKYFVRFSDFYFMFYTTTTSSSYCVAITKNASVPTSYYYMSTGIYDTRNKIYRAFKIIYDSNNLIFISNNTSGNNSPAKNNIDFGFWKYEDAVGYNPNIFGGCAFSANNSNTFTIAYQMNDTMDSFKSSTVSSICLNNSYFFKVNSPASALLKAVYINTLEFMGLKLPYIYKLEATFEIPMDIGMRYKINNKEYICISYHGTVRDAYVLQVN